MTFNRNQNGCDRIMCAPTRTKAVTMRLEFCLPFWLERQFHQCLFTAVDHRQDSERTPFCCSWLGDLHAAHRHWGLVGSVAGMNGGCHCQPLLRSEGFDAIDSR